MFKKILAIAITSIIMAQMMFIMGCSSKGVEAPNAEAAETARQSEDSGMSPAPDSNPSAESSGSESETTFSSADEAPDGEKTNAEEKEPDANSIDDYHLTETDYPVRVVDSEDLTAEMLENRAGKEVIIEKIIGKVLDEEGNGQILNHAEGSGDYISYRGTEVKKGDIVLTYCVYNDNAYVDDVGTRFDFVLESEE